MSAMFKLTQNNYQKVRSLVYNKSGINLGENRQSLVEARLQKRIKKLELKDFSSYLKYLQDDKSENELVNLIDEISTNYTFFYRELEHFDIFKKWMNSYVERHMPNRLRVWCAASSTGEEPYTIAMEAVELLENKFVDLKILATDISTQVLKTAHQGRYPAEKLKGVPKERLDKYWHFDKAQNTYEANKILKRSLVFTRLNLMTTPYQMRGPFDVIFCRNVMIYFDIEGRNKIIKEMMRLLRPGGILILGHSESMQSKIKELKVVGPSVYQRTKY